MPDTMRARLGQSRRNPLQPADIGRVDGARHDEALATLLERPGRRHQRAAPGAGLDHHHGVGRAADQAVALRKRTLGRLDRRRVLRHDGATGIDDGIGEPVMGAREEPRVAPADVRDGRAALRDDRGVRGAVDPDGEARTRRSRRRGSARPPCDSRSVARPGWDGAFRRRRHVLVRQGVEAPANEQRGRWNLDRQEPARVRAIGGRHDLELEAADLAQDGRGPRLRLRRSTSPRDSGIACALTVRGPTRRDQPPDGAAPTRPARGSRRATR